MKYLYAGTTVSMQRNERFKTFGQAPEKLEYFAKYSCNPGFLPYASFASVGLSEFIGTRLRSNLRSCMGKITRTQKETKIGCVQCAKILIGLHSRSKIRKAGLSKKGNVTSGGWGFVCIHQRVTDLLTLFLPPLPTTLAGGPLRLCHFCQDCSCVRGIFGNLHRGGLCGC